MFDKDFPPYTKAGDAVTCTVNDLDCTAKVYADPDITSPDDRREGFWPDRNPNSAFYVPPDRFDDELTKARIEMSGWLKKEWQYVGVAVTVSKDGVELTKEFAHAHWGLACNYPGTEGNPHLLETANSLLPGALSDAKGTLDRLCE